MKQLKLSTRVRLPDHDFLSYGYVIKYFIPFMSFLYERKVEDSYYSLI